MSRAHDWPLPRNSHKGFVRCTQCGLPRNLAEDTNYTNCLAAPHPDPPDPGAIDWIRIALRLVVVISTFMLCFCVIGLVYSLLLERQQDVWRMLRWISGSSIAAALGWLAEQLRRMPQTP